MARPIELKAVHTLLENKTERFIVLSQALPSTDYTVIVEWPEDVRSWWITDKQTDRFKIHIWSGIGRDIIFTVYVYHDAKTFEYTPP